MCKIGGVTFLIDCCLEKEKHFFNPWIRTVNLYPAVWLRDYNYIYPLVKAVYSNSRVRGFHDPSLHLVTHAKLERKVDIAIITPFSLGLGTGEADGQVSSQRKFGIDV